jgi:hypothetical protein
MPEVSLLLYAAKIMYKMPIQAIIENGAAFIKICFQPWNELGIAKFNLILSKESRECQMPK